MDCVDLDRGKVWESPPICFVRGRAEIQHRTRVFRARDRPRRTKGPSNKIETGVCMDRWLNGVTGVSVFCVPIGGVVSRTSGGDHPHEESEYV